MQSFPLEIARNPLFKFTTTAILKRPPSLLGMQPSLPTAAHS